MKSAFKGLKASRSLPVRRCSGFGVECFVGLWAPEGSLDAHWRDVASSFAELCHAAMCGDSVAAKWFEGRLHLGNGTIPSRRGG